MKIKLKEDLDNNLVHMTIKVSLRAHKAEENIILFWSKVEKLFKKNYKCPNTHVLGECLDKYLKLNNDYKQLCEQTWSWGLLTKKKEPISKTKARRKKASK